MAPPSKRPFFYAWLLLLLCLSNVMVANGVMHAFGVILVALLKVYGLSRAELSGIFSLFMLVYFGSGVLVGPLLDRLGPRKVIPLGALLTGLGLLACSRISSPFQLYFTYGLVTSLGACCVGWIPNSLVISNWFVRRRGMAVGLVMCGNGLGILIFIPLTQFIIEQTGWRGAFLTIAALVVLLAVPLNALFQCARPSDKNLAPDGDDPQGCINPRKPKETAVHYPMLWTLAEALRSRSFWLMGAAFFCNPFATFAIVLHQVALVVEKGFEPMYAASIIGALGIFTTGGRFVSGMLSDYVGREKAYTLFTALNALAVLSLLFLNQERVFLLPVYVVLMGMGMGVGGAMFPTMVADLFPGPNLGRIMGICAAFGGVGAGFGSWLAGYLHDLTGTYASGLYCIEIALAGAVVAVWLAAPRRARIRR